MCERVLGELGGIGRCCCFPALSFYAARYIRISKIEFLYALGHVLREVSLEDGVFPDVQCAFRLSVPVSSAIAGCTVCLVTRVFWLRVEMSLS